MPDAPIAGLVLADYTPDQSAEAMALERACPQGTGIRLTFRRSSFHRRAQNFAEYRIVTARLADRLVGVAAAAVKDALLCGESVRAAFFFDLRVHPGVRGRGVGRLLGAELLRWGLARASFAYTYALAENRAASHLVQLAGGRDAGSFAYLVFPVFRPRPSRGGVARVAGPELHAALLARSGGFDFYTNPSCWTAGRGYVASWLARRGPDLAGCSAWSNQGILGEVVESVPFAVRAAGALSRAWPFTLRLRPHVPARGEELRSWYLFDAFATDDGLARGLFGAVAAEALERGIDYCYIVHGPHDRWARAVRGDVPRRFAPVISYRLLARTREGCAPRIDRFYVDVRDL